tara:strand:+ start:279 stop:533 length:255 start_codon:yes stop_codon:yes gene_type:complete
MSISLDDFVIRRGSQSAGDEDKYYVHDQGVSSATWNVTHNLGKKPAVSVVDSANTVVVGEVTYVNDNSLTIVFQAAFAGKAYLN